MAGHISHEFGGKVGDDALVDALTSDDGTTRCMARLTSTGAMDTLVAWIDDELNNRRTDPADVVFALATTQNQFFASIVGSLLPESLMPQIEAAFIAEFRRTFARHAAMVREVVTDAA